MFHVSDVSERVAHAAVGGDTVRGGFGCRWLRTPGAIRLRSRRLGEVRQARCARRACAAARRMRPPDAGARNTMKPRACCRTRRPASPMAAADSEKSTARSAAITAQPCRRPAVRGQRRAVAAARRTAADRPASGRRPRRAGHAGGDGARLLAECVADLSKVFADATANLEAQGLRPATSRHGDGRAATPTRISSATRSWRCRPEKP